MCAFEIRVVSALALPGIQREGTFMVGDDEHMIFARDENELRKRLFYEEGPTGKGQ